MGCSGASLYAAVTMVAPGALAIAPAGSSTTSRSPAMKSPRGSTGLPAVGATARECRCAEAVERRLHRCIRCERHRRLTVLVAARCRSDLRCEKSIAAQSAQSRQSS